MDLIVIRHALPVRVENADGPADPPLSELGAVQARAMADYLAVEPLDALYSSPMRRARQTADPLAARTGHETLIEEGVAEFDRHADSYVPIEELKASGDPRYQQLLDGGYFATSHLAPEEFQRIVVDTMDGIIARHPGQSVAVVCHGGVINVYLAHMLGIDDLLFFQPTYTGITRIRASSQGHRSIVSVNETGHLRGIG